MSPTQSERSQKNALTHNYHVTYHEQTPSPLGGEGRGEGAEEEERGQTDSPISRSHPARPSPLLENNSHKQLDNHQHPL